MPVAHSSISHKLTDYAHHLSVKAYQPITRINTVIYFLFFGPKQLSRYIPYLQTIQAYCAR